MIEVLFVPSQCGRDSEAVVENFLKVLNSDGVDFHINSVTVLTSTLRVKLTLTTLLCRFNMTLNKKYAYYKL